MFRKILLFPFQLTGRLAFGSARLAIRTTAGVLRLGNGAMWSALRLAMTLALVHLGFCVLISRPNLPYEVLAAASIGGLIGLFVGLYQTWKRPKALPTPRVFRPGFLQRLGSLGKALAWKALMAPVVLFFVIALSSAVFLETVAVNDTLAADPGVTASTKTDLSLKGPNPTAASAEFHLETRPVLLASLAKVYADSRFSELTVARADFHNRKSDTVTDYRVRFRLSGYADWSAWSVPTQLQPQETVSTPYYPLLDEARLSALEGFALVDLQVEYEYRQAGEWVRRQETQRVKLMARNWMAHFHAVPEDHAEEIVKDINSQLWKDARATMPHLLPAFVTKDDPVIQQVAGWVSGQIGSPPVSDEGARAFMKALYEFMVANDIHYQLPAINQHDGWLVQHVHYGRDTLRNRGGCCIDLTIFFASVCEAVNLEPVLVLVPGHIMPTVRLPESKELVGVEVTLIHGSHPQHTLDYALNSYSLAVLAAQKQIEHARKGAHLEIDIAAQRKAGIQAIQLPALPANVLASWGIHAVTPSPLWRGLLYWAGIISGIFLVRRLWKQRQLKRKLRDENPAIRFLAVKALAQWTCGWSTRMLQRAASDDNQLVSQSALTALQTRGISAPVATRPQSLPTGLPSFGASGRALRALAAGEFDTLVMARQLAAPRGEVTEKVEVI